MIANQKIEYIKPSTIEQCIEKEGILIHENYNKFQESYITKHNIDYITEEIQNKVILEYLLQNVLKTNGSIIKEDADKYRIIASNILEKFKYNEALIELVTKYKEISAKISSIYNNSWNCIWLFLILHVIVAIICIIQIKYINHTDEKLILIGFIFLTLLPTIILIFFSNKEIYIENKLDNIKDAINLYNNFKFSFINHILIPLLYLCLFAIIVVYIINFINTKEWKISNNYKIIYILIFIVIGISIITTIYTFIKRYQYKQYRNNNIDAITINQYKVIQVKEIKKIEMIIYIDNMKYKTNKFITYINTTKYELTH